MVLYPGVDASQPGNPVPAGTRIMGGYVGAPDLLGQPDTPHIWTLDEWDQYVNPDSALYVRGLRLLPIYTHDYGGNAWLDAKNAVDAMIDLGWHPHWVRVLAWDSEFLVDKAYEDSLAAALWSLAGWSLLPYGVARTITQVPAPDHSPGVWAAALQPSAPRFLPAGWAGQQWQFGEFWDRDVFSQAVFDGCGRGPRTAQP